MSDLNQKIRNSDGNIKSSFIFGVVVILAATIYLAFMFLNKNFAVLYSQLDESEAASIVQGLKDLKVDYELKDGGSTILVDESQVNESKLSLMSSGAIPTNGVGLEIFDNTDYGMTEFAQKVNFQRAMQGELARTIMTLEEVKFARVHLTLPKHSIFADQQQKAKASITLVKEEGLYLNENQILGIQRLTASSVENLDEENVVVVDERGIDISVKRQADSIQQNFIGSTILERKKQYEDHLKTKVESLLRKGLSSGNYAVSIDVELDVNKTTLVTENLITPKNNGSGYIKKKNVSTKFSENNDVKGGKNPQKASEQTNNEYLYGKEVKQTEYLGGGIKSISVAVILPPSIPAEQVDSLRKLISATVGIDSSRGDKLQVHQINRANVVQNQTTATSNETEGPSSEAVIFEEQISVQSDSQVSESNSSESVRTTQQSIGELIIKNGLWILIGLVIVALVSFVSFFARRKREKEQRELVLQEIRGWLMSDSDHQRSNLEAV
ncbi:MAG: flagellar basal-body MS-ring/collar protein FliF [Kangiellaceae bacterium]|nr:flagellar basal-body MS-ring/collar protein FliF [Kangiellaceae bacterium]MCW8997666.1 flagellar basal-body MS-ring/collar protein FliF [Kangiellaceae bacterium]